LSVMLEATILRNNEFFYSMFSFTTYLHFFEFLKA
jgi:hypothetical protein